MPEESIYKQKEIEIRMKKTSTYLYLNDNIKELSKLKEIQKIFQQKDAVYSDDYSASSNKNEIQTVYEFVQGLLKVIYRLGHIGDTYQNREDESIDMKTVWLKINNDWYKIVDTSYMGGLTSMQKIKLDEDEKMSIEDSLPLDYSETELLLIVTVLGNS